jgi:hypothetical protein
MVKPDARPGGMKSLRHLRPDALGRASHERYFTSKIDGDAHGAGVFVVGPFIPADLINPRPHTRKPEMERIAPFNRQGYGANNYVSFLPPAAIYRVIR